MLSIPFVQDYDTVHFMKTLNSRYSNLNKNYVCIYIPEFTEYMSLLPQITI